VRAASAALFVRGGGNACVGVLEPVMTLGGNKAPPRLRWRLQNTFLKSRPTRWPTRSCCQLGVHSAAGCTPGVAYGAVFSAGDYRFLLVSASRPKYFRIRLHVHASVVVCPGSRCCRLPVENGIAVCATGNWRLAAGRETVLRQRQRSSTREQHGDHNCKSFHGSHVHSPKTRRPHPRMCNVSGLSIVHRLAIFLDREPCATRPVSRSVHRAPGPL
jgi:hypothetical protein